MLIRTLPIVTVLAVLAGATPLAAQSRNKPAAAKSAPAATPSSASKAAEAFTLDSVATPADAAARPADAAPPASPAPVLPAPSLSTDATVAAPPSDTATVRGVYTLDTPIAVLIADPAARAVLDRDLPGVSDDENIDKFKALSLRSFQPLTGGQLTDAMLLTVAGDLAKLAGGEGAAPTAAPVRPGTAKRGRDDSR